MDYDAQGVAGGVHDPDAAGTAAVDVALGIHLHPVGVALALAAQVAEDPVCSNQGHAVGFQVESPDVAAAGVVNVQNALVGRQGQAVGAAEVPDDEGDGSQVGRDVIDAVPVQVQPRGGKAGVGEIDVAPGTDDDVVGAVEAAAPVVAGDDGDAAVGFLAGNPAGIVLAGQQAAAGVAGKAVGPVGWFHEETDAVGGSPLHAAAVVDVAEEQVTALVPPQGALCGTHGAAVAVTQFGDGGIGGDDVCEIGGQNFYGHVKSPEL